MSLPTQTVETSHPSKDHISMENNEKTALCTEAQQRKAARKLKRLRRRFFLARHELETRLQGCRRQLQQYPENAEDSVESHGALLGSDEGHQGRQEEIEELQCEKAKIKRLLANLDRHADEISIYTQNDAIAATVLAKELCDFASKIRDLDIRQEEVMLREHELLHREQNAERAVATSAMGLCELASRTKDIERREEEVSMREQEVVRREEELLRREQELHLGEQELHRRQQELKHGSQDVIDIPPAGAELNTRGDKDLRWLTTALAHFNEPKRVCIDSGSTTTIISHAFLEEHYPDVTIRSSELRLNGIGGGVPSMGVCSVPIVFPGNTPNKGTGVLAKCELRVQVEAQIIRDMAQDMLIGSDFLDRYGVTLRYRGHQMEFIDGRLVPISTTARLDSNGLPLPVADGPGSAN